MKVRQGVIAGLLLALAVALLVISRQPVEFNIAPLAATAYDGDSRYLNVAAELTNGSPDAATDGLFDTLYMAEFEVGAGPRTLELRLPFTAAVSRLMLLGWDEQERTSIAVSAAAESGPVREVATLAWAAQDRVPPFVQVQNIGTARTLRLTFRATDRVVLNTIACFVRVPRWQAWLCFLGLNWLGPLLCGLTFVLAILGCGRVALARARPEGATLAHRLVLGILLVAGGSTAWCLVPRHALADALLLVLLVAAAGFELYRLALGLRRRTESAIDDRVLLWLVPATALLLLEVLIDTYLVAGPKLDGRRVAPFDHLISYLGAQRLSAAAALPASLSARPWLLHVLFAPLARVSQHFSYWCYLGVMAALNSLVLVPTALLLRRRRPAGEWTGTGLLVLIPILVCFHFPGQRPMSAAFALLAVHWWTSREPNGWLWAGLAVSIAFLSHPGALFVLPGVLAYRLVVRDSNVRLLAVVKALAVPAIAYGGWLAFVHTLYPDVRNDLMFYPLMRHVDERFDPQLGLIEIVRSLPAEHWRQLALNRLSHLRHYLWTDNRLDPVIDFFRYASLPNILGVVLTVGLLRRAVWKAERAFLWLAIVAPLLVHHAHIGHAHAQFHISPTPFFAVAALAVNHYAQATDRFARVALRLALVEWFLRRCYPVALTVVYPATAACVFATDQLSCVLVACLLPSLWAFCAWRLMSRSGNDLAADATGLS